MTHTVPITRAGDTQPVRPDGVVIIDPATGLPALEEQVVNLGDEQLIRQQGGIQEPFTAENVTTEFPLLNPTDSTQLGLTMTYRQVYVALHSLYFHVAKKRDEA